MKSLRPPHGILLEFLTGHIEHKNSDFQDVSRHVWEINSSLGGKGGENPENRGSVAEHLNNIFLEIPNRKKGSSYQGKVGSTSTCAHLQKNITWISGRQVLNSWPPNRCPGRDLEVTGSSRSPCSSFRRPCFQFPSSNFSGYLSLEDSSSELNLSQEERV